jgi:hypothetical protein
MSIQAMKQAIEALKGYRLETNEAAIKALEQAIEQAEKEFFGSPLLKKEQEMSKKIEGTPLKFEEWYALNFGEALPNATFYMSALKHAYECGVAVEREACARELQRHASYIIHSTTPNAEWDAIQVLDDMANTIKSRGEL